jgi:K+-sensing histidine kinase KdpD
MEDMRRNLIDLTSTLRRSEAEAQAVLGGIVEGVYAVDRERIIRYLNPQAEKLLGVGSAEAVGRFCGDVLKPRPEGGRRPCEFRCPIVEARGAGSARALERLASAGDAVRTTVITSAAPADGLQVQVMRDETELEAVRRARDSVLANISHEFRTPLAAQLASIELLLGGLEHMPRAAQRELLTSLERSTVRLTQLIDNLLESVRIESGQLAIREQRVALEEVVADAEALVGALLRQRQQRLAIELPGELPPLTGDKTRLTQVFVNLLANANKFAPAGSAVRVGGAVEEERILLWVEDEGPGIPGASGAAGGRSLFDRFVRLAGEGEEPETGGMGLGLWIVRSIVERHGGAVEAGAGSRGRGTRLKVLLPRVLPGVGEETAA